MPRLAEEWFVVVLLACLFGVLSLGVAFAVGMRRGLAGPRPGGSPEPQRAGSGKVGMLQPIPRVASFGGLHCRWLAIRSDATATANALIEAFGTGEPDGPEEAAIRWRECGNGWRIRVGAALPDPAEDIDRCYRLVRDLSVRVGWVQFFSLDRILGDHAWVVAERGRILRAYAWAAGQVLWNQGIKTAAERELGVTCLDYCETCAREHLNDASDPTGNVEKVFRLAAAWGVDPLVET